MKRRLGQEESEYKLTVPELEELLFINSIKTGDEPVIDKSVTGEATPGELILDKIKKWPIENWILIALGIAFLGFVINILGSKGRR